MPPESLEQELVTRACRKMPSPLSPVFLSGFFLEEHLKFNVVRVAGVPRLSLLQSLGVLGFPAFSFSPSVHRTLTRPYAHLLLIIQM